MQSQEVDATHQETSSGQTVETRIENILKRVQSQLRFDAPPFIPTRNLVLPAKKKEYITIHEHSFQDIQTNYDDDDVLLNEDYQFMKQLIESLLKYDMVIKGDFVLFLYLCGNVKRAILKLLAHASIMTTQLIHCKDTLSMITYLERDMSDFIDKSSTVPDGSKIIEMSSPYGLSVSILCSPISQLPQFHSLHLTSHDLLALTRDGLKLDRPSTRTNAILRKCVPLLYIFKQIDTNRFSWLSIAESLFDSEQGQRVIYARWKSNFIKRIYSESKCWDHPSVYTLYKHLLKESSSCCLCLGGENLFSTDAVQQQIQTQQKTNSKHSKNSTESIEKTETTADNTETSEKSPSSDCSSSTKCSHIRLLKSTYCQLQRNAKRYLQLPCKHIFHTACFSKIKMQSGDILCPLCREAYSILSL